mmetsp:Transcript_8354/g.13533  ORF Transcript_8354/g.13533 Transcript_8354/m.13533 type:complete len:129 (+) Transcript_8354:79-465(+)|eukprot:CAMPEP_0203748046 /NCGR_PEP_ID=MMETSP0098-20131031/3027_1 /ASSEMBLY_ACC=CAM_ASM_000208 /TAXON_ID=96639 /ORGANISM=" , Strain NY0313808BC1" /LENGTH=128 /DNA_ID=CAMNT_0050636661 /DNA_START=96 /DNA_END=482 /DNA_ORIENTATION=+
MVVKTDVCAFSEFRIYPGHGIKFIRKDGQPVLFISSKCTSLYHQRKKPAKLTWTVGWRRLHKKDKQDEKNVKRKRRVQRGNARPIAGVSIADIRKKREEKPAERHAAREAAKREVKERLKKKAGKGRK